MLQYLSGSDEVGAALWSLVDALQLRLPGSTEDFGFTGFEGGGQTGDVGTITTGQASLQVEAVASAMTCGRTAKSPSGLNKPCTAGGLRAACFLFKQAFAFRGKLCYTFFNHTNVPTLRPPLQEVCI